MDGEGPTDGEAATEGDATADGDGAAVAGTGWRARQARCQQHHAAQQRRSGDGAHDEARRDRRLPAHRQRAYQYQSAEGAGPDPPLPFGRHDRTTRRRGERGPHTPAAGAADRAGRRAAHGGTPLVRRSDDRRRPSSSRRPPGRAAAVDGPVAVARGTQRRRPADAPSGSPAATPEPTKPGTPGHATRVVIPALNIDLPIVGGPERLPVLQRRHVHRRPRQAAAWTSAGPAATSRPTCSPTRATACSGRSTSRRSIKHQPAKMLGMIVQVYTRRQQALPVRDRQGAASTSSTSTPRSPPTREELWLQTSEGPGARRARPSSGVGCCRSATRIPPTRTPRPSRSAAAESASTRLDPVDPAQEHGGHRGADHDELGDRPEPAALAVLERRRWPRSCRRSRRRRRSRRGSPSRRSAAS